MYLPCTKVCAGFWAYNIEPNRQGSCSFGAVVGWIMGPPRYILIQQFMYFTFSIKRDFAGVIALKTLNQDYAALCIRCNYKSACKREAGIKIISRCDHGNNRMKWWQEGATSQGMHVASRSQKARKQIRPRSLQKEHRLVDALIFRFLTSRSITEYICVALRH